MTSPPHASASRTELLDYGRRIAAKLDHATVDARAEAFDFWASDTADDGRPIWSVRQAVRCADCARLVLDADDHGWLTEAGAPVEPPERHAPSDPTIEPEVWAASYGYVRCPRAGDGPVALGAAGPIMSFRWPARCRSGAEPVTDDQVRAVAAHGVCVVRFGPHDYFAACETGQDIAWSMACAYVALGALPPACLAEGVATSSVALNPETAVVVAALALSVHTASKRAGVAVERVARLAENAPLDVPRWSGGTLERGISELRRDRMHFPAAAPCTAGPDRGAWRR